MSKTQDLNIRYVHTGQHYDWEMSEQFIRELRLPEPDDFLRVGSGRQGYQTSRVLARTEDYIRRHHPTLAIVQGDTNSALGVALAAAKMNLTLAHIEAGCRSFNRRMPEEINRIIITDCADVHFAATPNCASNLRREGVETARIKLTGHPIVPLVHEMTDGLDEDKQKSSPRRQKREFVLFTLHRKENVDDRSALKQILKGVTSIPENIIFPVHPRTKVTLRKFGLNPLLKNIQIEQPLGYSDTLRLIKGAYCVITDSGGIQQEAYLLKTPCITVRSETEWIETVRAWVNFLSGTSALGIKRSYSLISRSRAKIQAAFLRHPKLFGDDRSAIKISALTTNLATKAKWHARNS